MNLLAKLVNIRKSVEYIQKTEKGNQGAMYVDNAILVQKIRAKMDEANILLVPEMTDKVVEQVPSPTKNNPDGKGYLFTATMNYVFMDTESDDKLAVPWCATGKHATDPAMAGGAALTYFERYFLLKFFQIPTSKDDPEYFKNKTATAISPEQVKELASLITDTDTDKGAFLTYAKVDALESIHPLNFGALKSKLLAKKQAQVAA
jgi:hypothetical protein